MNESMNVFTQSIIYSCIAFSIVFIVLGGLTLVIYAMRMLTGSSSGSSSGGGKQEAATAAPAPKVEPAQSNAAPAVSTKSHHVAAITAAILAATHGKGRILSVTPDVSGRTISSDSTKVWKTAATLATASRRLAPAWKR